MTDFRSSCHPYGKSTEGICIICVKYKKYGGITSEKKVERNCKAVYQYIDVGNYDIIAGGRQRYGDDRLCGGGRHVDGEFLEILCGRNGESGGKRA